MPLLLLAALAALVVVAASRPSSPPAGPPAPGQPPAGPIPGLPGVPGIPGLPGLPGLPPTVPGTLLATQGQTYFVSFRSLAWNDPAWAQGDYHAALATALVAMGWSSPIVQTPAGALNAIVSEGEASQTTPQTPGDPTLYHAAMVWNGATQLLPASPVGSPPVTVVALLPLAPGAAL